MSTYVERSAIRRQSAQRPARERRRPDARVRPLALAAWEELWKRTVGGSFDRLPDPTRHPECWFKIV